MLQRGSILFFSNLMLMLFEGVACKQHYKTSILGFFLASKRRPRLIGIAMLCMADICVLLAVMCACILGSRSTLLLLAVLAITSCTTPLFVERISRDAKSSEQSKYELMSIQQRLDTLLIRYYQELTRAIQSERSSLSSEL